MPITIEADGVARVGGSRVTLDTVIGAFRLGNVVGTMLDAFKTNGSSPPKRYRLKVATSTVVREPGQAALPRRLSSPHPLGA